MASVLVMGACTPGQEGSRIKHGELTESGLPGFDVNDVAFLFPKEGGRNEASPAIKGGDLASDGKPFLSSHILQQILSFSEERLPGRIRDTEKNLEHWRVQSFRFDPCAPKDASWSSLTLREMALGQAKEDCQVEIRLVLQPMEPLGNFAGSGRTSDVSLHMTYGLTSGSASPELARLVKELEVLRALSAQIVGGQTAKVPLGRHPGLAAELEQKAPEKPLANAVTQFLQRNLKESQLVRITFSQVDTRSNTRWLFFGGSIVHGEKGADWIPFDLPHDPKTKTIEYRPDDSLFSTALQPKPETLSTNPLFGSGSVGRGVVLNPEFGVGSAGRKLPLEEAQKLIETLENPSKTNIFTTDCVSCHTTTSRAITLGLPALGMEDRPQGITGYAYSPALSREESQQRNRLHGPQINTWNVRNFGFFELQSTVSNRTVNEAMGSALYINALFFDGKNPGLDCVEADREGAVATCLMEGKRNDCFEGCKK
jgi:hypothetical protein